MHETHSSSYVSLPSSRFDKPAHYVTPPESPASHKTPIGGAALANPPWRLGGMEGDNQRQYEQSSYQPLRSNANIARVIDGASDRSRMSLGQLSSNRTSSSVGGASAGAQNQGLGVYTFTQGAQQYAPQLQEGSLQYQTDFSPDGQRSQQFPTYTQNLMYNLPPQAQQPTDYDQVQQFQPRQSAAIEVLSSQFNVPQYYSAAEHASTPSQIQMPYISSSYQPTSQFHQSPQSARPDQSSPYTPSILDYSQMSVQNVMDRSEPTRDRPTNDDPYSGYLDSLRQTYRDTQYGRLVDAGHRIVQVSDWIASHAVDLGLTRDEPSLYQQRMEFWNDFNICWLALLQRQKDLTQNMIASGQAPLPGQAMLQEEQLERMAREMVRMCDGLERHGLVDYQMGVWEEEIMNVLLECLQLLEDDVEENSAVDHSNPPSRTATSAR